MSKRMPNAVEYEEYLSSLTPEQIEQARSLFPVAFRDQMRSAEADSFAALMAAFDGVEPGPYISATDYWMRLALVDTWLKWASGTARTCMHMPDYHRPQPVAAAAWKPGLVSCVQCMHLFQLTGDADRTCDCCGRIDSEGVHPVGTTFGCLTYFAGVCDDCSAHQPEGIEK
jgi:hypothetical protein